MRTSFAVLRKQYKDSLSNPQALIVMIIYPAVAFVMICAMGEQEGASRMFIAMFATMHCCFAPTTVASNILSEEKEKGTLRSLLLSGVGSVNYLISISLFVVCVTMLTGSAFLLMEPFDREYMLKFGAAMLAGTVLSTLLGLCIGIYSQNVAAANGMAVPAGLVLSLIPMLAQFNDRLAKISRLLYSGQISLILRDGCAPSLAAITVMAVSLAALSGGLILLFRKKGLE